MRNSSVYEYVVILISCDRGIIIMSRNTKHLYTELAFEDGFALVDESIAREQIRQKRLKRQRARKKARRRASCGCCCLFGRFDGIRTGYVP